MSNAWNSSHFVNTRTRGKRRSGAGASKRPVMYYYLTVESGETCVRASRPCPAPRPADHMFGGRCARAAALAHCDSGTRRRRSSPLPRRSFAHDQLSAAVAEVPRRARPPEAAVWCHGVAVRRAREPRQLGAPLAAGGAAGRRARPGGAAPPRAHKPAAHGGALRRHRELLRRRADRDHAAYAPPGR